MWIFNKHTLVKQGIFQSFIDNHSHILPGVDDGVRTMEEALAIINDYENMGVSQVWLTPHIQDFMPNKTHNLQATFEALKKAYTGPVVLHLAAEYMLDALFHDRLNANDLLFHSLPGEEKRLLVETSYFNPPMDFWNVIQEIKSAGIRPILAHPERYLYMSDDDYSRLRSIGVIFQMNLPSVLGLYGKEPRKRALRLLAEGYYSIYGSDIHSHRLIHSFQEIKISPLRLTT